MAPGLATAASLPGAANHLQGTQLSTQITSVNDADFDSKVAQSDLPVLIDFWAPWCGPCMALLPTIEALVPMYASSLKVVKVNVDENPQLAERFGVQGIPHLTLVKAGVAVADLHERSRTRLADELDRLLG
jgi:thioredoxin 1